MLQRPTRNWHISLTTTLKPHGCTGLEIFCNWTHFDTWLKARLLFSVQHTTKLHRTKCVDWVINWRVIIMQFTEDAHLYGYYAALLTTSFCVRRVSITMVRWSFGGFWKMLASKPFDYMNKKTHEVWSEQFTYISVHFKSI